MDYVRDHVRDYLLEAILVLQFALAVLAEGLPYAILPVLFWYAGRSWPPDIRIAAVLGSGAAAFAIACFSAWRKQFLRAEKAEERAARRFEAERIALKNSELVIEPARPVLVRAS